jgi:chemotaxis signal transduction protein
VSVHESEMALRLAELKRTFDQSFAAAPGTNSSAHEDLLTVGIGGDSFAIRLSDVAGLLSEAKVTRLPGSATELLGLMGLRGTLVPVYDLRALLGYPRASAPRWLLIAAAARVALGFDRFDGHLRLSREAVSAESSHGAANHSPYVREVVRTDHDVRPIVHMPSVLDAIAALVRRRPRRKGND